MGFGQLGIPGSASNANLAPGQGYFSVPTGIQRIAEQATYSTLRFAAGVNVSGSTDNRFFSSGLNQPGTFTSPQSISETNLSTNGMLSGAETFEVSALACEVFGATNVAVLRNDLLLAQRIGILRWNFQDTIIMIAPLSMVGAGGGIFGFTADTGTPVTQVNNGNGGYWVYQRLVVSVSATQPFAVVLSFGTAGQSSSLSFTNETQFRLSLFNMNRIAIATG
jgi:hypothetical protein